MEPIETRYPIYSQDSTEVIGYSRVPTVNKKKQPLNNVIVFDNGDALRFKGDE